jgi:hypothetical protein
LLTDERLMRCRQTDIIATAFSLFIFWAGSNNQLTGQQGVATFVAILTGTAAMELNEALVPKPPQKT